MKGSDDMMTELVVSIDALIAQYVIIHTNSLSKANWTKPLLDIKA